MILHFLSRPQVGQIDRVCHVCGDTYFGWNFVKCPACEAANVKVTVVHDWAGK